MVGFEFGRIVGTVVVAGRDYRDRVGSVGKLPTVVDRPASLTGNHTQQDWMPTQDHLHMQVIGFAAFCRDPVEEQAPVHTLGDAFETTDYSAVLDGHSYFDSDVARGCYFVAAGLTSESDLTAVKVADPAQTDAKAVVV